MDRSLFPNFSVLDGNLDWAFWQTPRLSEVTAWAGHVPFAFWLVRHGRPGFIVELGTHSGVSYSAFCEAVVRSKLSTKCVAVDTWRGDEHTGAYGDAIYEDLKAFNDSRYGRFSTLLRKTFDEALNDIYDGSVDLLHIDGFHTYEAVRHDFESWRPKLSERAVVLFHDIAVREGDFGVWRFWEEVTQEYRGFAFTHSSGLGVLQYGPEAPEPVKGLCSETDPYILRKLQQRFEHLGGRVQLENMLRNTQLVNDVLKQQLEGALAAGRN